MAILRWEGEPSPSIELNRLRREVDRLFEDFGLGKGIFLDRAFPAVNLSEDEENFYVRAELPGVEPENLDVTCVEGSLVIRGERKIPEEAEDVSYHRREREAGSFRRVVSIPERANPDRVSAMLRNGILTLTFPKAEEAKPQKISVKAS